MTAVAVTAETVDALTDAANKRIVRYRGEATSRMNHTVNGSMTRKRSQEQQQRIAEAGRFNLKADHLEAWRDRLVDGSLPVYLLAIGKLSLDAYDWLITTAGWPNGEWNKAVRANLIRCGLPQAYYAERRQEFLDLKDAGPVTGSADAEIKRREAAILPGSIPGYFPTPAPVIERLLLHADIMEGDTVLEPSAGSGAIADALRAAWGDAISIYVCEKNYDLADILTMKGHAFPARIGRDFMLPGAFDQDMRYDKIIGNPPFERGQDAEHIQKAYSYLAPEGVLVMICSEGPFFRSQRADVQFRIWLSEVGAETEQLPQDAFKKSGTSVGCRIVVISK